VLVLHPAATVEELAVGGDVEPAGAEAVRDLEREVAGDGGRTDAEGLAGPGVQLVSDLVPGQPRTEELVVAELLERVHLEPVQGPYPGQLEGPDHDVAVAVPLDVEERIRDGQRDLVAQLRRAYGVRIDHDVRHSPHDPIRVEKGAILRPPTGSFPGGSGVFLEESA
jgi:hypothetical protein